MRALLIALFTMLAFTTLAAAPGIVTLDVQNMTCAVCPITVKKALEKVPGVSAVKVSFEKHSALVTFDPDQTGPEALVQATTDAGYPSTVRR
jgi:mercuric ion binding protein